MCVCVCVCTCAWHVLGVTALFTDILIFLIIIIFPSLPSLKVPVMSWFDDSDTELLELIPFEALDKANNVLTVLTNPLIQAWKGKKNTSKQPVSSF